MAKRKKKRDLDDWEEEPDVQDLQPEAEVEKVSLRDFVVPQKVSAFVRNYEPCSEGDDGYEQFDDGRLREVFKAYVCGLGDPLKLYIEDLQFANFRMEISMATGEPCIFAKRRPTPNPSLYGGE
jgi:hypothetical protein